MQTFSGICLADRKTIPYDPLRDEQRNHDNVPLPEAIEEVAGATCAP